MNDIKEKVKDNQNLIFNDASKDDWDMNSVGNTVLIKHGTYTSSIINILPEGTEYIEIYSYDKKLDNYEEWEYSIIFKIDNKYAYLTDSGNK